MILLRTQRVTRIATDHDKEGNTGGTWKLEITSSLDMHDWGQGLPQHSWALWASMSHYQPLSLPLFQLAKTDWYTWAEWVSHCSLGVCDFVITKKPPTSSQTQPVINSALCGSDIRGWYQRWICTYTAPVAIEGDLITVSSLCVW